MLRSTSFALTAAKEKKSLKERKKEMNNKKLMELTKPVVEYIRKNYHPHTTVIIDCVHAELLEGAAVVEFDTETEKENKMSNYKKGDKFIIEIKEVSNKGKEGFYLIKGLEALRVSERGLDKLERLEVQNQAAFESIVEERKRDCNRAYKEGLNSAWELALKLRYMDYEDKLECFGLENDGQDKWVEIMEKLDPEEAFAKLKRYEEKKDEIKVGDVILSDEGHRAIVTYTSNGIVGIIWGDGSVGLLKRDDVIKKTGEHFDIQQTLNQLGGE